MSATRRLGPLRSVRTETLEAAYVEAGPPDGEAVLLLHDYPYDIHSNVEVMPRLADAGLRVITPYLRGHGPTRFLNPATPRSGRQAALGRDVVELMDALEIPAAVLAGYDWGARAPCLVAALWPERCAGLVSVNGYLIQDIAASTAPLRPELEAGFWYFFYFATEPGRRGLIANRRDIAKVIWTRNSPAWRFTDETLDRAAEAFENDDYVEVVIHSYRHRLGLTAGDPQYDEIERALATQPVIGVPAVTLDGLADGNFPATTAEASAHHFAGPRISLAGPGCRPQPAAGIAGRVRRRDPPPRAREDRLDPQGRVSAMVSKTSPRSVSVTVAHLLAVVATKGLKVFAMIDHNGEAASVGLELRETKVVIFGSPSAETR